MRLTFLSVLFLFSAHVLHGQKDTLIEKGTASYVSSQNTYVKFASTEHIQKGDTLFSQRDGHLRPTLLVRDKSSTSCVCASLPGEKPKVGDEFFAKTIIEKRPTKDKKQPRKTAPPPAAERDSTVKPPPVVVVPEDRDNIVLPTKQKIKGRISAASYSNFNGTNEAHRMRYTLTFQGNNIKQSRFSTDNYISFRHTIGEWQTVKDNLADALKVYSLSVKYDYAKHSSVSLGRKINNRISSMGAIDGLQMEHSFGQVFAGAIAGSRPDYADYGLNLHLFQTGAYVGHATRHNDKTQESTLAFVEQRNQSKTDRRFAYFQHSNSLAKNLNLFGSFEVDLFQNLHDTVSTKPSLTNLLLSLRYRVSKKLNINAAYDNRKNIIYYESYKNYIDQLIDDETRQGLRVGASYRFSKLLTGGANASWRFQKSDLNLSKNLNAYLNISRLPLIKAAVSLSANMLQTNYLDSRIYGVRASKELVRGKLNGELYFRKVEYTYKNYEVKVQQEIMGADLSWNISRKLAFYVYYEGTFDHKNEPFNRFNTKLIQRF
jgi:hypothetical protein